MWTYEDIIKLLTMTAKYDIRDCLLWGVYDDYLKFSIICSDFFYWGCADCEEILPNEIELLEQAIFDLKKANVEIPNYWGTLLFCARKRKMKPQYLVLKDMPTNLTQFFINLGD